MTSNALLSSLVFFTENHCILLVCGIAQVNTVWDYTTGLYYITPNKQHTFCCSHSYLSNGTVIVLGGEAPGDAPYYAVSVHASCMLANHDSLCLCAL
jgi:hypothetical protein